MTLSTMNLRQLATEFYRAEREGEEDLFDEIWDEMDSRYGDEVANVVYAEELEMKAEGLL